MKGLLLKDYYMLEILSAICFDCIDIWRVLSG